MMKTTTKNFLKKYVKYLIRWQLSTPILTFVLKWLSGYDSLIATIIANFIGGLLFFWYDSFFIFSKKNKITLWEIKEEVFCSDCGKFGIGYRIAQGKNYDKTEEENPKFRCKKCSDKKTLELKNTKKI